MDNDLIYMVLDASYLKISGMQRAMKFARTFNTYIDVIRYLASLNDPYVYEVIPVSANDYKRIKEELK